MPIGYFRRLSIKSRTENNFFFILHFFLPKFCDFFYSDTLDYTYNVENSNFYNRYNRCQDTLHRRSDDKEKNFVLAKDDHNFTIIMENFH